MSHARIVIRCNASPTIGLGHVIRCQALAQAIQRIEPDCQPLFVVNAKALPLLAQLADFDFPVITVAGSYPLNSIEEAQALVQQTQADIYILDGYDFDADYEDTLSKYGRLLCVDDGARSQRDSSAGWILNSAPGVSAHNYLHLKSTLWLGPAYHPLRESIYQTTPLAETDRSRTLIMFGGSDPQALTSAAIHLLRDEPTLSVITGPGVKNHHDIATESNTCHATHYHAPANLPQLMNESRWALVAAGSVVYELMALRVPFCAVQVADNQQALSHWLTSQGVQVLQPDDIRGRSLTRAQLRPVLPQITVGEQLNKALAEVIKTR